MGERFVIPRPDFVPHWEWGFTTPEARVFAELVRQDVVPAEFVAQHLPTTAEFVEGMASKVRRFGVGIFTAPDGQGWQLEHRQIFQNYCPPIDFLREGYRP